MSALPLAVPADEPFSHRRHDVRYNSLPARFKPARNGSEPDYTQWLPNRRPGSAAKAPADPDDSPEEGGFLEFKQVMQFSQFHPHSAMKNYFSVGDVAEEISVQRCLIRIAHSVPLVVLAGRLLHVQPQRKPSGQFVAHRAGPHCPLDRIGQTDDHGGL